MIEGHGNDIYKYQGKIAGDFSSNIVYCGMHKDLEAFLSKQVKRAGNYPDPHALELKEKIAAFHHIKSTQVLVTNGSAEAFYLIAHSMQGKKSAIAIPSFAEYEDACKLYKHDITYQSIHTIDTNISVDTDAFWLGIPNNPDGKITDTNTLNHLLATYAQTRFVVDTAYEALCPACKPLTSLHEKYFNLISVHSLTKTFAIPGLRIGYIVAAPDIIENIQHLCIPWSVNTLAIAAGCYILDNYARLQPDVEKIHAESSAFQKQISAIKGLKVYPSDCNYFLVQIINGATASVLKQYLIEKHGLLIRDASNFRGLDNTYFRLALQNKELNHQLITALNKWATTIHG